MRLAWGSPPSSDWSFLQRFEAQRLRCGKCKPCWKPPGWNFLPRPKKAVREFASNDVVVDTLNSPLRLASSAKKSGHHRMLPGHRSLGHTPRSFNSFRTSRICLHKTVRRSIDSRVNVPSRNALVFPRGAPDPLAPPCIRQRIFPCTAGERQGVPARVVAPQRGLASMHQAFRRCWTIGSYSLDGRRLRCRSKASVRAHTVNASLELRVSSSSLPATSKFNALSAQFAAPSVSITMCLARADS